MFIYSMIRNLTHKFDDYIGLELPCKKMAKVIHKYRKDLTYEECYTIAMGIWWNDGDKIIELFSKHTTTYNIIETINTKTDGKLIVEFSKPIKEIANIIFKYNEGSVPVWTRNDCYTLAIGILDNNSDQLKKVISYTDKDYNRIFPR